ncbi:MAG: hypothetical protein N2746_11120 [Deltaproteobacteria bacterium]|nr:hypothetical protein [Deltaproteobacteria bacterium]
MRYGIILIFVFFSVSDVLSAEWELDRSHSGIYFSIRHLGISNVKVEKLRYICDIWK